MLAVSLQTKTTITTNPCGSNCFDRLCLVPVSQVKWPKMAPLTNCATIWLNFGCPLEETLSQTDRYQFLCKSTSSNRNDRILNICHNFKHSHALWSKVEAFPSVQCRVYLQQLTWWCRLAVMVIPTRLIWGSRMTSIRCVQCREGKVSNFCL